MDPLGAVGDSELRKSLIFVRAQPRPVTAADLAQGLALPRSVARWRLERLAEAGLLTATFERRSGRSGPGAGRPAKTYVVAPESAPIEFPRRRSEALVGLLMRALPRNRRAAQLREVGEAFAAELAGEADLQRAATTAPGALEGLCHGLRGLGYHASVDSVSETDAVIVTATCPLRPFVNVDGEARAIDEAMWRALVDRAGVARPGGHVACHTDGCLDAEEPCRILITFTTCD